MTGQEHLKSTQDALKSCEKRFRLMYEKAPVPYLTLDDAGCILSVNPAWEKLLGYTKADVPGTSFYDLLPPLDAEKLRAYFTSIDSSEQIRDIEINVRRKDGSLTRVYFSGFKETGHQQQCQICFLYPLRCDRTIKNPGKFY